MAIVKLSEIGFFSGPERAKYFSFCEEALSIEDDEAVLVDVPAAADKVFPAVYAYPTRKPRYSGLRARRKSGKVYIVKSV